MPKGKMQWLFFMISVPAYVKGISAIFEDVASGRLTQSEQSDLGQSSSPTLCAALKAFTMIKPAIKQVSKLIHLAN